MPEEIRMFEDTSEWTFHDDPKVTKQIGDYIEKGDEVCLLEGGKAVVVIEAPCSGVVTRMLVRDGQELENDDLLYEISPIKTETEAHAAAMRILDQRFPDSKSRLLEIVERVDRGRLSESFKALANGTLEEIILQLSKPREN